MTTADNAAPVPLTRMPDGTFTFEAFGVSIHYPLASTCGRFSAQPSDYGFEVYNTGGGCTAWRREFTLDGRPAYMLLTDGDLSDEMQRGDTIEVGVYADDEHGECIASWWANEDGPIPAHVQAADEEAARRAFADEQAKADEFNARVALATEAAMNAGCLFIQETLGVRTGDFAGMYFSDPRLTDPVRAVFAGYLRAEEENAS